MSNSTIGIVLALISTSVWALCSIIFKHLGEKLEPIGMTTLKAIFSTIFLLFIAILIHAELSINSSDLIKIAASGILGIAIGDSLFFAALNRLSPLVVSLILFVCPDLFSGLFGYVFLNEMPSLLSWVGIFSILAGLSFLIFPVKYDSTASGTKITGFIFAILSLICTSYSMVIIKPVLATTDVITATIYRMFFAAILLLIYVLFSKKVYGWKKTLNDKKYNLKLIGTFCLVTVGGFWFSLLAVKYCQLIIASSLMSLEPLFILLFMMIFNHYKPERKEIAGLFVTVLGIILICLNY